MLLPIHVVAGGLAIVLGAVALLAKKGGTVHRRGGVLFVWSMLVMGITASVLGLRRGPGDLVAGLLAAYFAGTAWTTVRPTSPWTRRINGSALAVAVGLALLMLAGGVKFINTPGLNSAGVPFRTIGVMSLVIATLLLVAAAGDLRIMRSGMPRGGPRLARHLWRMCFALLIAAGSFFSIRERVAKVLPEPFTSAPMRALPILLLLGTMLYWLWRIQGRRTLPVPVRHDRAGSAARAGANAWRESPG
ncbi:MAG TPA: hypothetical protein VGC13_00400 [Longimicrobium sp.]|jgi:hypothetical protein|uniref:hypothetical protein n=1 Tax=Longimicrobium sp. TaxID=2029185 RepID=UPI002ED81DAF